MVTTVVRRNLKTNVEHRATLLVAVDQDQFVGYVGKFLQTLMAFLL